MPKAATRDKEGRYNDKGSILQDLTILNTYAPNIGTPKYMKQILTDMREIGKNSIGDYPFNNG